MSQQMEQTENQAALVARIGAAVLPEKALAPWMGWYPDRKMLAVVIYSKVVYMVGMELERQSWNFLHRRKFSRAPARETDQFDMKELTGAAYMFAFCANALSWCVHNYLPSEKGLRTRQAIGLGAAHGTAPASIEAKKPGLGQRIKGWFGGNDAKDKVVGE